MSKVRGSLSGLLLGVFLIAMTFGLGITIDCSTPEAAHIYFFGVWEIIAVCIWLYSLVSVIRRRNAYSFAVKAFMTACVFFGLYYMALTAVRIYMGTNATDSLDVFRHLVSSSSVFLLVVVSKWNPERIIKWLVGYFACLTVGWMVSVVLTESFSARFPDYPMTYLAFGSAMIPLLLYGLAAVPQIQNTPFWRRLSWGLLAAGSVFLLFSGSRVAVFMLLFDIAAAVLFFGILNKKYRAVQLRLGASFLVVLVVSSLLYVSDLYNCRGSIDRVIGVEVLSSEEWDSPPGEQGETSVAPSQDDKKNQILDNVAGYMEEYHQITGEEGTGINYDNPVFLSNSFREYYRLWALDQLKDDWLFSIKGEAALEIDFYNQGVMERSGTHNFLLDYLLCFGAVGTLLLAVMVGAPFLSVCLALRKAGKHQGGRRTLAAVVLTVGTLFVYACVQAIFSAVISLSILFLLLALWYQGVCGKKWEASEPKRICMLVTSGVVNDSRIIREANLAAESGYETLMVGRLVPELGDPDPNWKFSCYRIPIPRAANAGIAGKILERVRIGLVMTRKAIAYRPDLIHCNDFDTLPFGYLAAFWCDCALVYDSHELWSENELAGRSALGKRLVKGIEGFLARRCDGVISVSNAAGVWLRDLYDLKNLIVVTNCPKIAAVEQQPKSERFELLCHGMFAPDRGYEELIDCAALVEPHDIQVRLRGYGVRTQEYQERAAKTGQANIFFSEKVPSDQVCSAASASHVGIALTRPVSKSYELTVSNKLFEYLAAGLPVILSDVPEHRMLNERYHFGMILDKITPEALAEAAIRLKEDPALYQELRENAMLASRELCFEKEGEKLIALYRAAMRDKTMEDQSYETDLA